MRSFCSSCLAILRRLVTAQHAEDSPFRQEVSTNNVKGIVTGIAYTASGCLAFVSVWASRVALIVVFVTWFIPDQRVEEALRVEKAKVQAAPSHASAATGKASDHAGLYDTARLEALSDGVMITVMLLLLIDLKIEASAGPGWDAVGGVFKIFLNYLAAFFITAVYWVRRDLCLYNQ